MTLSEFERKGQNGAGSAIKVAVWLVGEASETRKQEWPFYREFYAQRFASCCPQGLKRIG
jgi:hypothetical protein